MTVPVDTGLTNPFDEPIVAVPVPAIILQEPPGVTSVSVPDWPIQMKAGPPIPDGLALTVTGNAAAQPVEEYV